MDIRRTALVLIDLQKESKFGISGINEVVDNAKKLVEECRKLDIPIIYTRQVNRVDAVGLSYMEPLDENSQPVFYNSETKSVDIFDEIAPKKGDLIIDKYRWSGFFGTSLDLLLKSYAVKHLLIGGMVTDGCLMTSVFDGYFRDYQINLVKDICTGTNEGAHMASILIMANWVYGIKIFNTKELVNYLHGRKYSAWESLGPDTLKFTPENMRIVFNKLDENNS